jgi:glycoprotein endo-alpha-1,2-mannosidase
MSYRIFLGFMLLLSSVCSAWSVEDNWTNAAGDRLWRTATNWSDGIPTIDDKAGIRNSEKPGPIIDSNTTALANQVVVGDWGSTSDTLEMTGGSLTTSGQYAWFIFGYYAVNNGTFNISAGSVNVADNFFVGFDGTGTMNMTGGSISVTGTFGIAQHSGSTGTVHLDGGTISCGWLNITLGGKLDIEEGTLLINDDARTTINTYVTNGWITAYGGARTVNIDFGTINPGKTTIYAGAPSLKAANPNPANGATHVRINPTLSWSAGTDAISHDVYFGTASPGAFRGNQTAADFDPGVLAENTTYFWRIDEHNASGTVTGDVWSFTTVPVSDYFVGAYYYPWYNNNNFNEGSDPTGSNTLAGHLVPQIPPQLGWYNQTNPDVIRQHYKWARYAGIDFFVTSYWGAGTDEDNTIRHYMFNNPDRGDIKLAVFFEPSITPALGNPITAAYITYQTNYLCDNYFNQPCYFRIDNKPVVFIYITRAMTDPNLAMCIGSIRAAARNKGIGELYIVGDEVWSWPDTSSRGINRISQMDAVTNYDVCGNFGIAPFVTDSVLSDWQNRNAAWKDFANSLGKQFIPAVTPGTNDKAVREIHPIWSRKLNSENSAFGTLFSAMLDRVKDSVDSMKMMMVTSWNEWHEDSQIEPTISAPPTNSDDSGTQYYTQGHYYEGYGMKYLNILRGKATSFAPCDYDNNYTVDFNDLVLVLNSWLESCSMANNCIEADLNSSGTVSLDDFANCARDWTGNQQPSL